ncbi:MAG: Fpg/Nei family DNA glycosylase [Chloroflexi bacterium]|nr:Fpg/Nei family DNA glycosylase [Chloroflexota bacterium]
MPELPELEVVAEVLRRRVVGLRVGGVELFRGSAIVVRDLTHVGFAEHMTGATLAGATRRGKFLVCPLEPAAGDALFLVINPKLTGRLQLVAPAEKRHAKTHIVWSLSDGRELRYIDQKTMGQVYLTPDTAVVPDFAGMGPEALEITREAFRERIRRFRGEIKGVLTRGDFVAGIGNAYADEILWAARLYPFRKRTQLKPPEIDALYDAMRATLSDATEKVRAEMGENIHLKPRDFMAVHMKSGEPCPRCGATISLIGANQRITNFCRTCQPGGMFRGM